MSKTACQLIRLEHRLAAIERRMLRRHALGDPHCPLVGEHIHRARVSAQAKHRAR